MSAKKQFIFRWKDWDGHPLEVYPSKADTPEEVWAWAVRNLRGAAETPEQGARNVRKHGEVVEVQP